MINDYIRRLRRAWSDVEGESTYVWVRWFFLRGLGVISLIAFISFWVQLEGLVGSDGILPVKQFLGQVAEQLGTERFFRFPTFAWLGSSDLFLHLMTASGVIASLMLTFNIAPALSSFLIWGLYLSCCVAGQVFMQYQWDNLLIETSFLAIFVAPWQWRPKAGNRRAPNKISIWLLRLLLFKLIFASGMVKLASGDQTWSGFTALTYHFFTQPLPTVFGWFFHQLPGWVLKGLTFLSLVLEIAVPFLIITTRKLRQWAGLLIGSLMVIIGLTGNYGFFNLLGILLCLSLFDDRALKYGYGWIKEMWKMDQYIGKGRLQQDMLPATSPKVYIMYLYIVLYLVVSLTQLTNITGARGWIPGWAGDINQTIRSSRTINSYGLVANMTTQRPEIMVQGSRNGRDWKTYQFKYKPDRLDEVPAWMQPHMPRLDWQMWFAALSNYRWNPWFIQFTVKLMKGKQPVLELLEKNPFPERPPRFIRAVKYRYRFTSFSSWWDTGRWWKRERQGMYVPAFSLEQVRGAQ